MVARLLIIDDSATMRAFIREAVAPDPRIRLVGEAADPIEARDKIRTHSPDVLTLDIEMPRMDGLSFLDLLMRIRPLPVVMISSDSPRGSAVAVEAFARGAVDCIGKPGEGCRRPFEGLGDRLVAASRARVRSPSRRSISSLPATGFRWNGRLVLIGASTGGVEALEILLSGIPADGPPIVVTQHMPRTMLERFAARLDARIAPRMRIARDGEPILPGNVYLAPGGGWNLVIGPGKPPRCRLREGEAAYGHCPSVEAMFASALHTAKDVVAVMLTGMGRDGAFAMAELRRSGARCLAQDAASSVIFGMPGAVLSTGAAEIAVPINRMSQAILELTGSVLGPPDIP
ncbi:chemotaxis-specific protein-glutamate methyltransferase CheB [Defluviimonas sp. WL0024]|uniref:Protein-glutamate methylesterase/protein-glutamine glutaminase n=2 Tax=Albidovulum TaxID=205889 RepID=A0ABT3IY38_9RHOB|nr:MULTISPECIES: chemotaxis-specific protein-glutamate methyltransferase CheB [Defluviimonas]MCU9846535.1 chemotaxis-specific protein-glutamate methyltransferase CheB [Defluviimonas sp. WL0024]MCW3780114.1 chemotaxis-specific protein-glutamate methyltransferase CheB [Defluviimonas salinarum]